MSQVGVFTGATAYSGQISSPTSRVQFHIVGAADADVNGILVTLTQATKRKTGTILPAISVAVLKEICGFLGGVYLFDTTTHTCDFSFPLNLNGLAYDPEGGAITLTLGTCVATSTITVYAINAQNKGFNYTEVTPIASQAGGVKQVDLTGAVAMFMLAANITRVKLNYPGCTVDYLQAELNEIARCANDFHSLEGATATPYAFCGYHLWNGINVVAAVNAEVTLTADGFIYVVKNNVAA
jgi:hypothetical protein